MKKIIGIFSILLFLSAGKIYGQLGIVAYYNQNSFESWNDLLASNDINAENLFRTSYKAGIDFAFEPTAYRIRFAPEINYSFGTQETDVNYADFGRVNTLFSFNAYSFALKMQIYPLDLLSNKSMECPSFYRGIDKFTKGWFFLVNPELSFYQWELSLNDFADHYSHNADNINFAFGIGTGIDIGLGPFLSITPMIQYSFRVGTKWDGFSQHFGTPDYNDQTASSSLSMGLRLGIWF